MDDLTRLLAAARDGDRAALAAFVRASQADVWRLASHLVGSDEADDVTQDVYLRAWRALPAYRGDAGARTWLLAIARRACADAVRRRVRRRRLDARTRQAAGDQATTGPAGAYALSELVDSLAPERREAFVLTQLIGCSYDEAAAACRVPVGTIRSRVARARAELADAVRAADTA